MWTATPPRTSMALIPLLLLLLSAPPPARAAGASAEFRTKRGLAYVANDHDADNRLIASDASEVSWYYTWSRNVARSVSGAAADSDRLRFVPMVHSVRDASARDLLSSLDRTPASSTHLLSFNEPDGEHHTGGSDASPRDAARAYIDHIVPLREKKDGKRPWRISHPCVTGSPRGLDWLRDFNRSCYELDADNGCPADFVAAHWYGDQVGLRGWLGQLRDFYTNTSGPAPGGRRTGVDPQDLRFWVTELALPQGDRDATLAMMNDSLAYLDAQSWVEGYAWFGAFRTNDANQWTGDKVALFDGGGGLTDLGALYLGGGDKGFKPGMTGAAGPDSGAGLAAAVRWSVASTVLAAALFLV